MSTIIVPEWRKLARGDKARLDTTALVVSADGWVDVIHKTIIGPLDHNGLNYLPAKKEYAE